MNAAPATVARCPHYWVLGPPQGEVMHATCVRCRAERVFPVEPEAVKPFRPGSRTPSSVEKQLQLNESAATATKAVQREKRTKKWYHSHRIAILQDFQQLGLEETRRRWSMRGNTLEKLLAQWGHPIRAMGQLNLKLPLLLPSEEGPYPQPIRTMADRILANLIEQKLISGNYLAVGFCILEALTQAMPSSPPKEAG